MRMVFDKKNVNKIRIRQFINNNKSGILMLHIHNIITNIVGASIWTLYDYHSLKN